MSHHICAQNYPRLGCNFSPVIEGGLLDKLSKFAINGRLWVLRHRQDRRKPTDLEGTEALPARGRDAAQAHDLLAADGAPSERAGRVRE